MESPRWKIITPSKFEWERRGLDFIRKGLPDHDPYRACDTDQEISASFDHEGGSAWHDRHNVEIGCAQMAYARRCRVRGVTRDSSYGVVELGTSGPARRSSSVSRMRWTGPPPGSFVANRRGPQQDGQAAKTKPLTRSCLRFWTRAWSQHGLAGERAGRLRSLAR